MAARKINILLIISLVIAALLNALNIYAIKKQPTDTYHLADNGVTLWSPDNEYYLDPVDNFLAGKEWRRNPPLGKGSYYRRTPGYSILYLFASKISGNNTPHKYIVLVCIQAALFVVSLYTIWLIAKVLTTSNLAACSLVLLFGISPVLNSYILYTITESLFPHLIIYYLYWLVKATFKDITYHQKAMSYCLASLFITLSVLTRPVTGILFLGLVGSCAHYVARGGIGTKLLLRVSLLIALPVVLLIGAWTWRNYQKTGDLVVLEVAFHPESHDRMKPEFKGLFGFVKCWGEDGAKMNEWQLPLYGQAIWENDTSIVHVKNALHTFPEYVVKYFGKARLQNALVEYQKVVYSSKIYYDLNKPMASEYTSDQMQVYDIFNKLTAELSSAFPWQYYVKTPAIYLSRSIFHSNTSVIYLFQKPFADNLILTVCKCFFFIINFSAYMCVLLNIWFFRNDILLRVIFCIVPLVYLGFFCLYFKEIEQRYLLPALIIALIGLYRPIELIDHWLKRKFTFNAPKNETSLPDRVS